MTEQAACRVFVADDSPSSLMVCKALLESIGCDVTVAERGDEALKILQDQAFDVVLLDHYMPGMNGADVARSLTTAAGASPGDGASGRLIALSGADSQEEQALLRDSGFDLVLKKPVSPQMLKDLIGESLQRGVLMFDDTCVDGLVSDLGKETAATLYGIFSQELQALAARLETAIAASEADEVAAVTHILKNSAAMYGANAVAEAARHLNESPPVDISRLLELAGELRTLCLNTELAASKLFP